MDCLAITIAALSTITPGLAFGFSSASTLQIYFTVSHSALFASSVNIGGLIGGLISAHMLSSFGRRFTLLMSCIPTILGWFWMYMCADAVYRSSFPMSLFIFGRLLTGVGAGLCLPSSATYILEISRPKYRGALCALPQVGIVSGVFFSFLLAVYMVWERIAFIHVIFSSIVLLLVWFLPESPKWLQKAGYTKEADNANMRLFGKLNPHVMDAVDLEDNTMESTSKKYSLMSCICPCLFIPSSQNHRLRIALGLMILQQFTGINAILFFAESICLIGSATTPPACALFIGTVQMIFTMLAVFAVNYAPRKHLLILSALFMAIAQLAYGITISNNHPSFKLTQFWISLFMFGYSFGWGPLPLLITMELFPVNSRGYAVSSAVAVNWLFAFIVTELFELLSYSVKPSFLFITFSFCCLTAMGYVYKYVPETNGNNTVSRSEGNLSSQKSMLKV
uniref:Major facilitator superfamily (MFS) profile domain-containing protein n=2 Tax=Trichobilharzia regenti TaxID=157069 RepID=A0AA85IKD4_TRIRE|nr:unnamed protein product [Trichobilharzia regenti]